MFWVFVILFIFYICLVIFCGQGIAAYSRIQIQNRLAGAQGHLEDLNSKKEDFSKEKRSLENKALEIFTLFEMTREITKSLSEQEAFRIFEEKLHQHVAFQECRFLDPLSGEVNALMEDDSSFVFLLKGEGEKWGYVAVKGLCAADKEKFAILGHQFALALRRVKLYREIEQIAITDSLTGLHTRRHVLERFYEEIKRSKMRAIKMSFLMVDVDFFKNFNDQYGHLTGDQILRSIGTLIRENIREIDIAGRYGGEEFCVILPDTDSQGARYAAERIRQGAESASIKAYDTTVKITVSIGIATFPQDGFKAKEIIDKADSALYRAKDEGRNRICTFKSAA